MNNCLSNSNISEETRKKMKAAWILRKQKPNYIPPRLGKHHSKEFKIRLSIRMKKSGWWTGKTNPTLGKHLSEETKKKISDANKGRNWKGGLKAVSARRRKLGFIPINKEFENAHAHHIDEKHVIFIPKKIHKSIWHSLDKPETMEQINNKAYDWLLKNK